MKRTKLGRSGIDVSAICLGSMTWGTQNTAAEGRAQIDQALAAGVDFIDTAEMYPTNPVRAETVGDTERVIGSWIAAGGRRDDIVIATKVSGPNGGFVRDGRGYDRTVIAEAVESSLKRLNTEMIDLYQLHWPTRGSYHFRQMWRYNPSGQSPQATRAHMEDVLEALQRLVDAGKIRAFGLSNESCWGTCQWLKLSDEGKGPRVASVQNEYSLLCRNWDTDMAELSVNEDVPLLSFSPLAAGLLSGKYQGDVTPEGTRRAATPDLGGRITPRVFAAVDAYLDLAAQHGVDPAQMAIAWQLARPFPVIPIIGATTPEQLALALGAGDLTFPPELGEKIDAVHRAHPYPY